MKTLYINQKDLYLQKVIRLPTAKFEKKINKTIDIYENIHRNQSGNPIYPEGEIRQDFKINLGGIDLCHQ